jgi:hypothetical protein
VAILVLGGCGWEEARGDEVLEQALPINFAVGRLFLKIEASSKRGSSKCKIYDYSKTTKKIRKK